MDQGAQFRLCLECLAEGEELVPTFERDMAVKKAAATGVELTTGECEAAQSYRGVGVMVDDRLDDLPRERKSERHDRIARGYNHRGVAEMGVER